MTYFNFKMIAEKAEIPKDKLEKLCALIKAEFPRDEMMYELHVLRACQAILEGRIAIDRAIEVQAAA